MPSFSGMSVTTMVSSRALPVLPRPPIDRLGVRSGCSPPGAPPLPPLPAPNGSRVGLLAAGGCSLKPPPGAVVLPSK
jgi:hypothetical protein